MARSCISQPWCHHIFQGFVIALLWKTPVSSRGSMQMNRSWSLTCQPCLCWCLHSWLHDQELPKEPLGSAMGPGQRISLGKSENSQHSRTAFPVVSCTMNKCLIAVALFIIQLLHMLVSPILQQETLLSELHKFSVTYMQISYCWDNAVTQQLFEISSLP